MPFEPEAQIREFLASNPSENQLQNFLKTIHHSEPPTASFCQLGPQTIKEPTIVYVQLAVQDIKNQCYIYPYVISRPFSAESKITSFKYGLNCQKFNHQNVNSLQYYSTICDRETIVCAPVFFESSWVKEVRKDLLKLKKIEMHVDELNKFKLGQVFSAICLYQPEHQALYYIRDASAEEKSQWDGLEGYLSEKIDHTQTRDKILSVFNKLFSEEYSLHLLYSLISADKFFLSAFQNPFGLIEKLLPRVGSIEIKAPFKKSLFPYKNEDEEMIETPMQMSNERTYVILDFSKFSEDKEIKIEQEEIDNLKALKVFVEEGNTIYRWVYGESIIPHQHSGLVVRASNILNPNFVVPQKESKFDQSVIEELMGTQNLRQFRSYLSQVSELKPIIKTEFEEIEKRIKADPKKYTEEPIRKVLELSKLNAQSAGRQEIMVCDFEEAEKLYFFKQ